MNNKSITPTRQIVGLNTYLYTYRFTDSNIEEVKQAYLKKKRRLEKNNKIIVVYIDNAFAFEARKLIIQ